MSTPSQIKGTAAARAPHAQSVLRDPQFVAIRPGSGKACYWANKDRPWEIQQAGYRPVRYEEVETLPGGTYTPESKDFGVYWDVTDFTKKDVVRMGSLVLMQTSRDAVDARRAEEAARMTRLHPTKTDKDERANFSEGDPTTLGKEAGE